MIKTALYLGLYPSIILFNEDFDEFKTKFKEAETYVIPSTDLLTFLLGILIIMLSYKTDNRLTNFFELTKPLFM